VLTLTPAPTAYVEWMKVTMKVWAWNSNTWASTVNINALWFQTIQDRDGDALWANQLIAWQVYDLIYDGTNFKLITIEKASDSDVSTGTDDIKYVTSKQVTDNILTLRSMWTTTRSSWASTWTESIAHWLSRTPTRVTFYSCRNGSNWSLDWSFSWVSDWTNNFCIAQSATIDLFTTACINIRSWGNSWIATATFDATNIDISWVKAWSWVNVWVIWVAEA
jgi:hypothetical protein